MIIDISQELFTCSVYPGDPAPERRTLMSTENGNICNLTALSMCAHNGTHIDAPYHFYGSGKTVDQLGLEPFVGSCWVTFKDGEIGADDARRIMQDATAAGSGKRILIGGKAVVTAGAAQVFADAGIKLIGNESQTVGPEDAPAEVHYILLGAEVVLLEGIRLGGVSEGRYILSAAPINLGGCDGAPCRAYLVKEE